MRSVDISDTGGPRDPCGARLNDAWPRQLLSTSRGIDFESRHVRPTVLGSVSSTVHFQGLEFFRFRDRFGQCGLASKAERLSGRVVVGVVDRERTRDQLAPLPKLQRDRHGGEVGACTGTKKAKT